ncbi:MAG: hypothetical protein R3326_07990, partial [Gemmatimonadota bacterium]|nr:hypothetical protein [Gemmatimonadota bacterium]
MSGRRPPAGGVREALAKALARDPGPSSSPIGRPCRLHVVALALACLLLSSVACQDGITDLGA